jgi:P-type E1-E2 ATPase
LTLLHDIKHPVAASVLRHLEDKVEANGDMNAEPVTITEIISVPGSGVQGHWVEAELTIRAGSPDWLNIQIEDTKHTLLCITINNVHSATFRLIDRPRDTAQLVISKLHNRGITTHMISGDTQGAVDNIAHTLGIPRPNTKARCKPDGKKNYVSDLQDLGKVVMFVGDGTNDSIALKQAHVGVHINQTDASDVAKRAADVVLMTTRLPDILILLDISHAAYRRIILNFVWSGVYNVSAVLLAAGVFTGLLQEARIDPQFAGLGELVSVLPVVFIAFQMSWKHFR